MNEDNRKRALLLEKRMIRLEKLMDEEDERTDVIRKVGNSWRILGKKAKYWPAHYKTKTDAENALKAYWANKHESLVERYKREK